VSRLLARWRAFLAWVNGWWRIAHGDGAERESKPQE
jgi:hypothetical protein